MQTDATPKTIYLKDYTPPFFKAESIDLIFRIHDDRTEVNAQTRYRNIGGGRPSLILNGENLKLLSVAVDDVEISDEDYLLDEKTLTLPYRSDEFTLSIVTQIDPAANTSLEGLYQSEGNFCTQCESEGFRKITYFQDRPDVMTVFTTRIEAPLSLPVLLSNGNLVEAGGLGEGRHFSVWHDPFPKPCYLFALVAADLEHIRDEFITMSGRKVDLRIYVRDGDQSQSRHAMDSLIRSMKWDETAFGREYQLDCFNIVAVSDFNFGAMENTSLNIFNTALVLAEAETATDQDFLRVEGVVAHEYFHNWSGNRVTCRDWFQLSLKEGFTVFRDEEFTADLNSRAVKRIDDVIFLRARQFPEDAGPLAHPIRPDNYIEINNFYTTTVYEKGGEVIRMQKTLLGADDFRKGSDLYFDRHDGQAVTCDDFLKAMEDASDRDLSHFKLWYSQAGTPEINIVSNYDSEKKRYTLSINQNIPPTPGQPHKKPMHMPIAVGLISANGDEIVSTRVLELTEITQDFVFDGIAARPIPSILRNFSAPVKLKTDISDDDYRFLMIHDTDGFNRWEAGQIIAMRQVLSLIADPLQSTSDFVETISSLLHQCLDDKSDKALLARMLYLPDVSIVSQELETVDPDAIHAAQHKIMTDILNTQHDLLLEVFLCLDKDIPYSPDPVSMGLRALKRIVLKYIAAGASKESMDLAATVYDQANNMTDRMTGLSVLSDMTGQKRDQVFEDFYRKYKNYPLVVDKWFSVQAMAVRNTTLDDIAQLSRHSDFNLTNPNRVRSLYSALAMNNPVVFHGFDGRGYNLLLNAVLETDPINPHVSSRLLTAVRDWRRYTPDRRVKMQTLLEKIVATKGLSPHAFEIASKTLKD